ncbi:MAG: hypothetical protein ACK47B_21730 [Armatimonadota bacterium]
MTGYDLRNCREAMRVPLTQLANETRISRNRLGKIESLPEVPAGEAARILDALTRIHEFRAGWLELTTEAVQKLHRSRKNPHSSPMMIQGDRAGDA